MCVENDANNHAHTHSECGECGGHISGLFVGLMVVLVGRLESLLAPCASPFLLCPEPVADADVEDECDGNCDGNPGFDGAMPSCCGFDVCACAGEVAIVVEVVLAMLGLDFFFDESEEL